MAAIMRAGLLAVGLASGAANLPAAAAETRSPSASAVGYQDAPGGFASRPELSAKRASFSRPPASKPASKDVRAVADWVVASGDGRSLPFVIVDKVNARVFVFDSRGRLHGAAPALLGLARGDDSVPGIGTRSLFSIRPEERTTPAGRFAASLGEDLDKKDVLWVDYDAGIALHRVVAGNRGDHRLQRLATASPRDKRISYGCINVPVKFYETVVKPAFTGTSGVVYILPEIKPLAEVFPGVAGRIDANSKPSLTKINDGGAG
jgi:hypothetical protein